MARTKDKVVHKARKVVQTSNAGPRYGITDTLKTLAGLATAAKTVRDWHPSHTKTQTKKKQKTKQSEHQQKDTSTRSIWINYSKRKLSKGPAWEFSQTYGENLTALEGLQNYTLCGALLNPINCVVRTGVPYDGRYQSYEALFELNPFSKVTGSALYGNTEFAEDKIICESVRMNTSLKNMTSNDMCVDMYVVQCKKNTPLYPDQAWNAGLVAQGGGQTVNFPPIAGLTTAEVEGYATLQGVFQRPKSSVEFSKLYKISRVAKVQLAGGAAQDLNIFVKLNKVLDKKEITDYQSEGIAAIANMTVFIFAVVRGGVVLNEIVSNNPTYGAGNVAFVSTSTWKMKGVAASKQRLPLNTYVQRIPTGSGVASEKQINEIDIASFVQNA